MKQQFIKYFTVGALTLVLCGKAFAGGTMSLGYSQYNLSGGVDLGAIYGSAGYEYRFNELASFTPEVRVGTGVNDDRLGFSSVEIDTLYGFASRFSFYANDSLYFYATVSYVNYKFKVGRSSVSTWEPGFGAGAGFYFTERVGLEFIYENVDSSNVGSAALRFRF